MDYREYIRRTFGLKDGSQLLKPSVYPDEELERDIISLEVDRDQTESKIGDLHEKREALTEEGVGAPEYKKQALATEIDLIETEREQYETTYQTQTDKLGLLRAIRGARMRMKSDDLSVDQLIDGATSTEIEAAVRDEVRDLQMESKKVGKILDALQISSEAQSSSQSSSKNKYIKEMEEREEAREYSATSTSEEYTHSD